MAYTRIIRIYYQTEKPIPADRDRVYRLVRASSKQERQAVDAVLDEFFTLTDQGYTQRRCEEELAKMREKSDKARKSIEARWKNERNTNVSTNEHTNVLPTKNEGNTPNSQEPITNNQRNQNLLSGKPDHVPIRAFNNDAKEIIDFLNAKTGRHYQHVDANLRLVAARLKEGASVDDCRAVIAMRCRKWSGDPKMDEYLRPATLFNATNFAQYRGELADGNP